MDTRALQGERSQRRKGPGKLDETDKRQRRAETRETLSGETSECHTSSMWAKYVGVPHPDGSSLLSTVHGVGAGGHRPPSPRLTADMGEEKNLWARDFLRLT